MSASLSPSPRPAATEPTAVWTRRSLLVLAAITTLAMVARLWGLRTWAWSDAEAATWRALQLPLGGADGFFATTESHAPLVHLLLRGLVDLGLLPSLGEGALRLPFAFFGIVTVPLLAVVGQRFVGTGPALFAAALLALHPTHVAASQTAAPAIVVLPLLVSVAAAVARRRFGWAAAGVLLAGACAPIGWTGLALLVQPWLRGRLRQGGGAVLAIAAIALVVAAPEALRWPFLTLVVVALAAGAPAADLRTLAAAPALAVLAAPQLAALAALPGLAWIAAQGAAAVIRRWAAPLPALRLRTSSIAALPILVVLAALVTDTFLQATLYQGGRPPWRTAARAVLATAERSGGLLLGVGVGRSVLTCYLRPQHWREPGVDPQPRIRLQALRDEPLAPQLRELLAAATERSAACCLVLRADERQRAQAEPAAAALLGAEFVLLQVLPAPGEEGDASLYVYRRRSAT